MKARTLLTLALISAALFLASLMAGPLAPATEILPLNELLAKAAGGDIAAQLSLAFRHRDGKGVKRDYAEAMRGAHLAADRGDAAAMGRGRRRWEWICEE